jgi:hypothetical protein
MRLALAILVLLFGAADARAQGATGVNPPVGSVWTYMGPTYGAQWVPPGPSSGGGQHRAFWRAR